MRIDWLLLTVLALYGAILVGLADTRVMQGLDADRYALMESLVERGTTRVDDATFASVDRAKIGDHFYSEKAPLLSFAGAAVYWGLYHGFGWSFRIDTSAVVRVMIALFVVLPVCVMLGLFHRVVWRRAGKSADAWTATALLAVASLALPYSVCFTNHALAASLLFGAFFCVAGSLVPGTEPPAAVPSRLRDSRWLLAGGLAALSACVDLIPGSAFLGALLLLSALRSDWRSAGLLAVGAAGPAVLHIVLTWVATGRWLLAYFAPSQNLLYEGSIWRPDAVSVGDYEPFRTYWSALYHYVLGHRSVFLFMPLLVYGVIHAVAAKRRLALAALVAFFATILLVPAFSLGLAGGSYGPRHIVPVIPLMVCFAAMEFTSAVVPWRRVVAWVLAVWCAVIAAIGTFDPWTPGTLSVHAPLDVLAARAARRAEIRSPFAEAVADRTAYSRSFAWYELGRIYRESGKALASIAAYRKSLSLEPDRPLALYALGVTAGEAGYAGESIDAFEKLTRMEPDNAGAWSGLGLSLLQSPRAVEAHGALEKALSLNPDSRGAKAGFAEWHKRFGDKPGGEAKRSP
jgi:tetratricopeptide (TPR) repeat protein